MTWPKNGNIERVRDAVYAGWKTRDAICHVTGLDPQQVENACKRIKDIRRDEDGWVPASNCLLANVWH